MPSDRILIVEDERPFAEVVQGFILRLGYEVAGIADSGEAALRTAEETHPALALMDLELQGEMNGFQVAELLYHKHDIPSIILTGSANTVTVDLVRNSESFGYLLKPFRPEELKASIELALIRHRREVHFRRSELSFAAAIKSAEDGVVLANQEGLVTFLNPAAERITGWFSEVALGKRLEDIFQIQMGTTPGGGIFRAAEPGAFVREAVLVTGTGRGLPVEFSASVVWDEVRGNMGSVLVFRDVTTRKLYEASLKQSQAELRSLAGHLESAREAERTRIAREIHDEFGQLLTGFKIDLSWLEKKLAATPTAPPTPMLDKVQTMMGLIGDMVQCVRRISAELRPAVLDNLGLAAAVEWQVQDFQKRTGVKAHVRAELSDRPVPREVATAFFRVLQESLTNVSRHAGAKTVRVRLLEADGQLVLHVSDDGRGISENELSKAGAFGLLGMRERILPLRGQCEIRGLPGRGTTVHVTVPLNVSETSEL